MEQIIDPTVEDANVTEHVKVVGQLTIEHFDEFGEIIEKRIIPNLVVTTGKNLIASRLAGTASAVVGWMEVGTSSQAAAVGDTGLILPVSASRTALTSITAGVPTTNAVRHIATFAAGVGTGSLTEAGLFNASIAGTMLCRTVYGVITKGALDSITITWDVTIS